MPLPIAHSAAGLAGYLAFEKRDLKSHPKQELLLGLCLFLANLPDLDFIPGLLIGEPGKKISSAGIDNQEKARVFFRASVFIGK
jgi:hypothetical protein